MTKEVNKLDIQNILKLVEPEIIPSIKGIASPFKLYRYDKADDRYYYSFPEEGDPKGYLSCTSFTHKSLGIGVQLYKWASHVGSEFAKFYSEMRAAYGTHMHITITEILKSGKGDFDKISDQAFNAALELGYKHAAHDWQSDIVKDVAAFMVFAKEKELEVIGAEFPICSDEYGLAGCIDLIARIKFNGKLVNCLIDLKSGRKGFYESHELQLHTYAVMFNDLFSEIFPITHVFNWAPNDWKKKPSYKLKNQTGSEFSMTVADRMKIAKHEGWINPPTGHLEIEGAFDYATFDINNHLSIKEI